MCQVSLLTREELPHFFSLRGQGEELLFSSKFASHADAKGPPDNIDFAYRFDLVPACVRALRTRIHARSRAYTHTHTHMATRFLLQGSGHQR